MSEDPSVCAVCGANVLERVSCRDLFYELSAYTLSHEDPRFIHQHVVDAYAAQHAAVNSKPIATTAALIGLHLFVEKGYSGRQVQRVHMRLGNRMKAWPEFAPPSERAGVNVAIVTAAPPGPGRDRRIEEWARSVWGTWAAVHSLVAHRLRDT